MKIWLGNYSIAGHEDDGYDNDLERAFPRVQIVGISKEAVLDRVKEDAVDDLQDDEAVVTWVKDFDESSESEEVWIGQVQHGFSTETVLFATVVSREAVPSLAPALD